jgi:hypothetical protein
MIFDFLFFIGIFLFGILELHNGSRLRKMTKCPFCNREMDETTDTCEFTHIKVSGKWYQRKMISYGGETLGKRCSGCGILIAPRHYHHYGCVNEECPKCWRAEVKCDCKKEALKHGDLIIPIQ